METCFLGLIWSNVKSICIAPYVQNDLKVLKFIKTVFISVCVTVCVELLLIYISDSIMHMNTYYIAVTYSVAYSVSCV